MRTNEERIAAMHSRAAELKKERARLHVRLSGAVSMFSCLLLVILLAAWMPGTMAGVAQEVSAAGMSGSMFSSQGALGYVVIAIIAFLLGVSVTVFCFRLRQFGDFRDDEASL